MAVWIDGRLDVAAYVQLGPHPDRLAWRDGAYLWAALSKRVVAWCISQGVPMYAPPPGARLVVEGMRTYNGRGRVGDTDDLLNLQGICGALAGIFSVCGWGVMSVLVTEWNGQLHRDVREARTLAWLDERGERGAVVLPSAVRTLGHNVYSAVGIGRWALTAEG